MTKSEYYAAKNARAEIAAAERSARQAELDAKRAKADKDRADVSAARMAGGIFQIIIFILLAVSMVRILSGHSALTFTSFLEQLSNSPSIPLDWLNFLSTNFAETFPYGFQWLGSAIDFFVDLFSGTLYAGVSVTNALVFIFYFCRWIFI